MSESTIPSGGCPNRAIFLGLEHDSRLLIQIAAAELPEDRVPLWPIIGFLLCQNARMAHEDACPRCAAELAAVAA